MKSIKITKRTVFYILLAVSLMMLLIALFPPGKVVDSGILSTALGNYEFSIRERLLVGALGLSVWLIIYGFFIKKQTLEWIIMIILFIPHVILILVMKEYSHDIMYMLRMYLLILSFGFIAIRG